MSNNAILKVLLLSILLLVFQAGCKREMSRYHPNYTEYLIGEVYFISEDGTLQEQKSALLFLEAILLFEKKEFGKAEKLARYALGFIPSAKAYKRILEDCIRFKESPSLGRQYKIALNHWKKIYQRYPLPRMPSASPAPSRGPWKRVQEHRWKPNYVHIIKGQGKSPRWIYNKLRLGMSREEAEAFLGEPSCPDSSRDIVWYSTSKVLRVKKPYGDPGAPGDIGVVYTNGKVSRIVINRRIEFNGDE